MEVRVIEKIVRILDFAEEGTKILGADEQPPAHIHDVVMANNLQVCKEILTKTAAERLLP